MTRFKSIRPPILDIILRWRQRRRVKAEIQSMSDYELRDIGLTRGDVGRLFDPAHNQDLLTRR